MLWVVQTILSAGIAAEPSKYYRIQTADQLIALLIKEYTNLIEFAEFNRYFQNAPLREKSLAHLDEYLTRQACIILDNIRNSKTLEPVPEVGALQDSLKGDLLFRTYIQAINT